MTENLDFEATMAELERIARALDGDELDLDDALSLFEAGVHHVRRANHLLEEVRGRIEELIETSSGEQKVTELDVPEAEADEP
jgi:exodeoxyribonuclease VII small subunit